MIPTPLWQLSFVVRDDAVREEAVRDDARQIQAHVLPDQPLSESSKVVVVWWWWAVLYPATLTFFLISFYFGLSYSEMRRLLNVSLLRLEEMEEILTAHFNIY